MSQEVVDLGWVDFGLRVPPSGPAAQPLLPNSLKTELKMECINPGIPPSGMPCRDEEEGSSNSLFSVAAKEGTRALLPVARPLSVSGAICVINLSSRRPPKPKDGILF